jgi:hypothetical protein
MFGGFSTGVEMEEILAQTLLAANAIVDYYLNRPGLAH